jgi:hypothetical protein
MRKEKKRHLKIITGDIPKKKKRLEENSEEDE